MAKRINTTDPLQDTSSLELDEMLQAREVEVESLESLKEQRGTPIPALYNQFYKFIQNPSSVSVDTFKRMIDTDDTVGAGVDFLTTCLAARFGRWKHPSSEVTEWVNKALDAITGGWQNKLKEMLSAPWAGFYVGEKVWENREDGFYIKNIAPLPPTTLLFEVERTGELTPDGILQYQRNWSPTSLASGIGYFGGLLSVNGWTTVAGRPDPFARFGDLPFPMRTANQFNYLCVRIPTAKCVHYAFDAQGKFGNPYGRSLLRRIYKYWVLKDTILRMMATALDRKGTPLTIVWADPVTTIEDEKQVQANGGKARGSRVGKRADSAALEAFKNVHNDSVIVLPGKRGQIYDVEAISQQSNAGDFIQALDFCNKSMLRGLLIPALIFGSGDGSGSFSLGQEHARTFDKILDGVNTGAGEVAKEQIVRDLLMYNFPRSAWEKDGLGEFSQRELTTEERQKEMEVIEKAVNIGMVDLADLDELNEMREKVGMSARDKVIERPEEEGFGEEGGEPGNEKGKENEEE